MGKKNSRNKNLRKKVPLYNKPVNTGARPVSEYVAEAQRRAQNTDPLPKTVGINPGKGELVLKYIKKLQQLNKMQVSIILIKTVHLRVLVFHDHRGIATVMRYSFRSGVFSTSYTYESVTAAKRHVQLGIVRWKHHEHVNELGEVEALSP